MSADFAVAYGRKAAPVPELTSIEDLILHHSRLFWLGRIRTGLSRRFLILPRLRSPAPGNIVKLQLTEV